MLHLRSFVVGSLALAVVALGFVASPASADTIPPPTNVHAALGLAAGSVVVTWDAPVVPGHTVSFEVGGPGILGGFTISPGSPFNVTPGNGVFTYEVRTLLDGLLSTPSSFVSSNQIAVGRQPSPCVFPQNVAVTSTVSGSHVSWTSDPNCGQTPAFFEVESLDGSVFAATAGPQTFADVGNESGPVQAYHVRAIYNVDDPILGPLVEQTPYSFFGSSSPFGDSVGAPRNVHAAPGPLPGTIDVTWDPPTTNGVVYEYHLNNVRVPGDVVAHRFSNLADGVYSFSVTASILQPPGATLTSTPAQSNDVQLGRIQSQTGAFPHGLTAVRADPDHVRLRWTAPIARDIKVQFYEVGDDTNNLVVIAQTTSALRSIVIPSPPSHPLTGFRVRAVMTEEFPVPVTTQTVWSYPSVATNSVASVRAKKVPEGNTNHIVMVTITLSHKATAPVTVFYSPIDGGTASPGLDYVVAPSSITFAPGQRTRKVPVTFVGDTTSEPNETINFAVTSVFGPAAIGDPGIIVIVNDDH